MSIKEVTLLSLQATSVFETIALSDHLLSSLRYFVNGKCLKTEDNGQEAIEKYEETNQCR